MTVCGSVSRTVMIPDSLIKTIGRRLIPSLSKDSLSNLQLEFKPHSQSHVEWRIVATCYIANRRTRLEEIGIWWISSAYKIQSVVLVWTTKPLAIEDVEEIRREFQLCVLSDAERVISVGIKATVIWRTTLAAASTDWHLARIQINRMRIEFVNWQTSLVAEVDTEVKTIKCFPATSFVEGIAAVHVNDVPTITVEWSHSKLITEQIEISFSEVKQRTDAGISLTVVIAKVTLEVALQLGYAPIEEALPSVRERAVEFNLERSILTHGVGEPIGVSIRDDKRVSGEGIDTCLSKADGSRTIRVKVIRLRNSINQSCGTASRSVRDQIRRVENGTEDERLKISKGIQRLTDVRN